MTTPKVLFCISQMTGFGADKVMSKIAGQFVQDGISAEMMVTSTAADEVVAAHLSDHVPLCILRDFMTEESIAQRLKYSLSGMFGRFFCKIFEKLGETPPAFFAYASFMWLYHREVYAMRAYLQAHPTTAVIAFLQPTIPIVLLAARGLPNRIIISERADPARIMLGRYGGDFAETYYARADVAVFQTKDASLVYPNSIKKKIVIVNPISDDLPAPYHGEREKRIVTFGRFASQKNLPLLIDAFALFYKKHPDYVLEMIGDLETSEAKRLLPGLQQQISERGLNSAVHFKPFSKNVHEEILNAAMYVNSSDFEGISNSMLEAMAIGLPVICTDCPAGGARATIQNGENGILVPVRDTNAVYHAMCEIAENAALSQELSRNGQKLREELSLRRIAVQWEEVTK